MLESNISEKPVGIKKLFALLLEESCKEKHKPTLTESPRIWVVAAVTLVLLELGVGLLFEWPRVLIIRLFLVIVQFVLILYVVTNTGIQLRYFWRISAASLRIIRRPWSGSGGGL